MIKFCKVCGVRKPSEGRRICYHCRYIQRKENNLERLCYTRLRNHAKERNKAFDITFEQFKEFCIKSNYLNCKGIRKNSLHIDRIDESKGYSLDNIQAITNTENVKKYIKFVCIDKYNKKIFCTNTVSPSIEILECPF